MDAVLAAAVASTRPGGTCVNVSISGPPRDLRRELAGVLRIHLVGSLAYANRHEEVIELIRSGTVDVDQFITGRIGLEDIVDRGFRELIDHKESNVKILVQP